MRAQARPCRNCQNGRKAAGAAIARTIRGDFAGAKKAARTTARSVNRAGRISRLGR